MAKKEKMREHHADIQHTGALAPPCSTFRKISRKNLFFQIFYMTDN